MLGRRPKKNPQQKGQGAAAAKQLGLFLEFNPEEIMREMEDDGDDGDLEAELAAITGENTSAGKIKPKGKTPLPMDHIAKMAADCMKDLDDDDDEEEEDGDELEEDNDLLAELQEVLGEGPGGSSELGTETIDVSPVATDQLPEPQTQMSSASSELQRTIEERITNYKIAIINGKKAGESAKVRRYERGLKTLEMMLTAVKKGKKVNEEEMPPPVASGKSFAGMPQTMCDLSKQSSDDQDKGTVPEEKEQREQISAADHELKNPSDTELPMSKTALQGQDANGSATGTSITFENNSPNFCMKALLVTREKEYKLAALKAKQEGDLEKAKEYMRTGKKFSMVLEALDSGQPIDLKDMPPSPLDLESPEKMCIPPKPVPSAPEETSQPLTAQELQSSVQQPKTVLEALEQRLEKYKTAAAQAKASGADRKSRMHERIAKQYQDAIRAHKAGRKVNFAELPVPPGFPPIPGVVSEDDNTVASVLESASRLVKMEEEEDKEDDKGELSTPDPASMKPSQVPKKPVLVVQPLMVPSAVIQEETFQEKDSSQPSPITAPEKSASIEHLAPVDKEQIEFLESRKKQYLKAAIQAKKKNNLEQAKVYLRTAKSFDPKIELAKNGKLVDISKLPSPPTDDEGDFIFIHHEDVRLSQKAEEVYIQLIKLLKDQHEKCMQFSKQFMHLGNVTETSRFEKLAQNCKKDLDILQLAQAQGLDPPSHHFEERTFKIVRIFSELNSTEMHLIIVRGINLPAPPGVTPNDLDAFVKFEFHYPNTEQAQKNKTSVIKNTNCPEYNQLFKLNINRNHRGFRRAIQAKGIKFEIFHKGSFFRSDKQVGIAHLKLDKLESECEIREIIEVLDGRKSTGGKLEVKVRLREPLSEQDLQTITENWLVLEH
ncbi:coiled-coil and C2 domain-containing protein 1B isoform X2 [Sphaerodactylus townsendi]|uniref:coiled-coil and C2 domain-containing protein 1B isoform X2 n=1 Tax=Sphaerodactylus townsendi TaxID=933632 RepID=UPI00202737F0|nr:coiled-coil and C2 domain-containing protein 1B isoform X2 [Sphaerodactylus townsendi]